MLEKVNGIEVYTPEMQFLLAAVNVLTCMGSPNWHTGTEKILDSIFEQYGAKETLRFLYLITKINLGNLDRCFNPIYFWNLFKECHEDLLQFKEQIELQASSVDSSNLVEIIPDRLIKEFN